MYYCLDAIQPDSSTGKASSAFSPAVLICTLASEMINQLIDLQFAEDIVLIGKDTTSLERMLKELSDTGKKIGL